LTVGVSADTTRPEIQGGSIDGSDRPFQDLTVGQIPQGDAPTGSIVEGRGIGDTIFRLQDTSTNPMTGQLINSRRMFQAPSQGQIGNAMPPAAPKPRDVTYHPFLSNEMLFKIGGNITTKSNVFAVWLTVGFFEVVDDPSTGRTNILGEEIGQSQGGVTRYRFFSIVDRTQLAIAPRLTGLVGPVNVASPPASVTLNVIPKVKASDQFNGLNGYIMYASNPNQVGWNIQAGTIIVVNRGQPDEETVLVEAVGGTAAAPTLTATFTRDHPGLIDVTIHGNPGPQPNWDPYAPGENFVVPYFEQLN
jgi:hypothetical protein